MKPQIFMFALTALSSAFGYAASMTHRGRSIFKLHVEPICPQDKRPCQTQQCSGDGESRHRKMLFMNLIKTILNEKDIKNAKISLALAQKIAATEAEKKYIADLQQFIGKQELIKTERKA
jgi:hypothetical protein